jgi:predicted aminopeptidase
VKLLTDTRTRLAQLYASQEPPATMRARKQEVFAALAPQIRALEQSEAMSGTLYDDWIGEGLNNAHLASVATYYDCVPGFKRLLASEDNDLERFYAAARALSRLPRAQRDAQLCGPAAAADAAAE